MAKNLKTDFVIIATSGETIDGRVIEKQWLQDMAETYKESVYSAKIWPDHERWLGSFGKVCELKVEPATDPDLEGEIHLMAILAPSDDLVYANRRGKYTHSSIEVLANFRNTGKVYLGGLAATDEPASVGTTELNFSADKSKFWIEGKEFSLESAVEIEEEQTLFEKFTSFLKHSKGDSQEPEPMSKELLDKIVEGQAKLTEAVTAMGASFKTLSPNNDGKDKDDGKGGDDGKIDGDGKTADDKNGEFVSKKDYDDLLGKFKTIEDKFAELQKTPAGGTTPAGDGGAASATVIC